MITRMINKMHLRQVWNGGLASLGKKSDKKNRFLSGIAQITSPPKSGKLYNFFWTSITTFLRVLQNQVTMITTMVWVIIVIIILVLLMILVLKMTKKYHITWYWCQNIRDNIVEKQGQKIRAGVSNIFKKSPNKNLVSNKLDIRFECKQVKVFKYIKFCSFKSCKEPPLNLLCPMISRSADQRLFYHH